MDGVGGVNYVYSEQDIVRLMMRLKEYAEIIYPHHGITKIGSSKKRQFVRNEADDPQPNDANNEKTAVLDTFLDIGFHHF